MTVFQDKMTCRCAAAFVCKTRTRDAGGFEVKVHSNPVTVMPHTKPKYEVAENIVSSSH